MRPNGWFLALADSSRHQPLLGLGRGVLMVFEEITRHQECGPVVETTGYLCKVGLRRLFEPAEAGFVKLARDFSRWASRLTMLSNYFVKDHQYAPSLIGLALILANPGLAPPVQAQGDPQPEMREIARQLQCPVCQNLSVLDSPSELATQMREVIVERLKAGESREAILQYFVDRYGEGILMDPPKRGFTLVVWWGPVLVALAGLILLAGLLRGWMRHKPVPTPSPSVPEAELEAYEALLQEELARRSILDSGAPAREPDAPPSALGGPPEKRAVSEGKGA